MLKTLRITSLAALVVAALGVLATVVFGFKGDPDIKAFLEQPGVTAKYKGQPDKAGRKADDVHPLVNQARLFALRIDPPPPPPPPQPKEPKVAQAPTKFERKPTATPPPPPVVKANFELLGTVRYAANPAKSLALLRSGSKIEWFRQGEKAGHLTIDEVRDGSIVVSQSGRNQQVLNAPIKQEKSLLKNDNTATASAVPTARPAAVNPAIASRQQLRPEAAQPAVMTGEELPVEEPIASSRVQRVRAEPPPPTPEEQMESLDSTVAGIQEIINRQDETVSEEERKAENEMWVELLNVLKSEKANLETAASNAPDEGANTAPQAQPAEAPQPAEQNAPAAPEVPAANTPPASEQGPTDEGEGQAPQPEPIEASEAPAEAPVETPAPAAEGNMPEGEAPAGEAPPNEY